MNPYAIGLSALTASERALNLIGENLANAATPGYHRQRLELSERVLGGKVGAGVEILGVTRVRDAALEHSLTISNYQKARLDGELEVYRQVETLFTPGPGSLTDQTQKLFSEIERLTQTPDDLAQRRVVVDTAANLAKELNGVDGQLSQLRSDLRADVSGGVDRVNEIASLVADYNQQIQNLERSGQQPNGLKDQRDQFINDLAELTDVRVIEQAFGVVNVLAAGTPLVTGGTSARLRVGDDANGLYVALEGTTTPLNATGGKIGAWLSAHNDLRANQQPRLDAFAQALASSLDTIQATGLPLGGPQTTALGARPVTDPAQPLAQAASLPVQAGSLFLTVTDQATGQRTLQQIDFDPTTQSLQDLAGAITTASGGLVQGSVTTGNRLQIEAQAGYAFDFAGRLPSEPTNVSMGGTSAPRVTGVYNGPNNGEYAFQIVGSGAVGQAAGLTLQVRDADGNVVGTYNVGAGYTPNTLIDVGNGLKVSLGSGTTTAGSFNIPVVGQADTTGALAALGVNSLFTGTAATNLAVRPEVLDDPSLLAASRNGDAGDGSNLVRLAAVASRKVLGGGTRTLSEDLAVQTTDAGSAVRSRSDRQTALASLQQNLFAQQQSVSGVDPNEELTNMLQAQRSFQFAAQFISTVNSTLDSLLDIVR